MFEFIKCALFAIFWLLRLPMTAVLGVVDIMEHAMHECVPSWKPWLKVVSRTENETYI